MRARTATAAMFFVNGAALGTWGSHVPFVAHNASVSSGVLGLCLLAMGAGAVVTMPVAGLQLDRRPTGKMTRFAALALTLLLPLPLASSSPVGLGVALLLFGSANGFLDVSMNAHGAMLERDQGRPLMSSLHGGWSLGALAGAGAGAIGNAADLDPRVQGTIAAAVLLVTVLVAAPRLGAGPVRTVPRARRSFARPTKQALLLGGCASALLLAEGALMDWSALYLRRDLGTSASIAATGYAAFAFGTTTGRIVGDRLTTLFGPRRMIRAGCWLAALTLGAMLASATPALAIPCLAVAGFALSNALPLVFSAAGRLGGSDTAGSSMAAVTTIGYCGLLCGPPVIGFVAQAASLPFAMSLAVVLAAGVALLFPARMIDG